MIKSCNKFLLAISVMSGTCSVYAASSPTDVTSQSADIVFSSPSTTTIKLTPIKGLVAGQHALNDVFANLAVSTTNGNVAFRWTPNIGTVDSSGNLTLSGRNNNKNHITLAASSSGDNTFTLGTDGWFVGNAPSLSANIVDSQDGTIAADTYTLSMDAASWVS
jgi:hypothetical protein